MTEAPPSSPRSRPIFTGDEIDLRQLSRAMWRYRTPMFVAALACTLMGAAVSLLSSRHVSEGMFQVPDLTLTEFKRYAVMLASEPRMREFVRHEELEGTSTGKRLLALVAKPERIAEAVQPVFALTGADSRLFDINSNETSGDLVGIRLRVERTEAGGRPPVLALAEYVRNSIIEDDLRESVLRMCVDELSRERRLRNESIQEQFQIRQQEARAGHLREIIASRPQADRMDSRQVVSVENGGERFLSPTTQLVAVDVAINELRLAEERRQRDRLAAVLRRDYYCRARSVADSGYFGREFFGTLAELHSKVFDGKDMTSDVVEMTANELEIQRQAWINRYLDLTRFVVSPEGAERVVRRPPLTLGLALGFFFGLLMSGMLALFLAWWHDHRDEIIAADNE